MKMPRRFAVLPITLAIVFAPKISQAQTLEPFFDPPQASGTVDVRLCPMENVAANASTLVTFGVPFPRGSVAPSELAKIRVLDPASGAEIAAHVELAAPWRSTDAAIDQKSVRVATVQIHRSFAQIFPAQATVRVEWGGPARTLNVPNLTNPRTGWHLATSGTFVAADSVFEPDVYALLPRTMLCNGTLKLARMLPYDQSVPENRENPAVTDTISHWPGYSEMDHAEHNFLFTINNDDDPLVTPAEQNPYKTDFEPWLYDRSAAMFIAYFRSGQLYDLRQAVRNGQFYLRHLYPPGTQPSTSVGVFDLKIPDPAGYVGGNGAMYSYAECLAYSNWLTGDPRSRTAVDWVIAAHETQDESPHWTLAAAEFTERHTAFRLLANTIGFEVTGNLTYRDSMLRYANDFIWHQNGAGGQVPAGAIDGGLYHLGSQHGDGTWTDFTASSWMTVLTQEAMLRVFALSEKPEIAQFIRRTGNFFNHAAKFDDQHSYDTYLGGAPLWYCDYMMLWDGSSDERDGSEVEHSLELADASAWASYFAAKTGQPDTALTGLARRLFFTYDQGVNHWTRPGGPAAGKAAFRVSPPRKYGWEYRPSGSFTWLMAQLASDSTPPPPPGMGGHFFEKKYDFGQDPAPNALWQWQSNGKIFINSTVDYKGNYLLLNANGEMLSTGGWTGSNAAAAPVGDQILFTGSAWTGQNDGVSITKATADGTSNWSLLLADTALYGAYGARATALPSGDVAVLFTENTGNGEVNLGIVRVGAAAGNIVWKKRLGNAGENLVPLQISAEANGDVWVLAFNDASFGNYVFKLAGADGVVLLKKELRASANLGGFFEHFLVLPADNSLLFCGQSGDEKEFVLAKFDASGEVIWQKNYVPPVGSVTANWLGTAPNTGEITLAGNRYKNSSHPIPQPVLLQTDAQGNVLWANDFAPDEHARLFRAARSFDGGFLLAAAAGFDLSKTLLLIKTDSAGHSCTSNPLVFTAKNTTSEAVSANATVAEPADKLVAVPFTAAASQPTVELTVVCDSCILPVAGYSFVPGAPLAINFSPSPTLPTDTCVWDFGDGNFSTGCQMISHIYPFPGTFTVCLTVRNACGADKICKTLTPVSATGEPNGAGDEWQLTAANPFSESLDFQLFLPETAAGSWQLFDLAGRAASALESRRVSAGASDWNLAASGLPAGMYLLRVRVGPDSYREERVLRVVKIR